MKTYNPKTKNWSEFSWRELCSRHANAEGWDLFQRSDNGVMELCRLDQPEDMAGVLGFVPKYHKDDLLAERMCVRRALMGSPLHMLALLIHGREEPGGPNPHPGPERCWAYEEVLVPPPLYERLLKWLKSHPFRRQGSCSNRACDRKRHHHCCLCGSVIKYSFALSKTPEQQYCGCQNQIS